jgi:hypothetical protein
VRWQCHARRHKFPLADDLCRTARVVLPIIVAAAAFGVTGTATANVATNLRATPTAPLVIGVDASR